MAQWKTVAMVGVLVVLAGGAAYRLFVMDNAANSQYQEVQDQSRHARSAGGDGVSAGADASSQASASTDNAGGDHHA